MGLTPRPIIVRSVTPSAVPDIPGYEILRELGRGGMGIVYEARHIALGRVVAVKTLPTGFFHAEELSRFRRESEAIARLDHPNIVPVYEVGERPLVSGDLVQGERGVPYFSMKFYPGGSLARRSGTASSDPRADARIVETIARAIHHAHQRGILHRDLKPSNILLDEAEQPHVTDFGLAKQFDPAAGATLPSGRRYPLLRFPGTSTRGPGGHHGERRVRPGCRSVRTTHR
ncbi:serine/threonine-protein kinase [Gemmata massiliana]|nr:serine/threonine-protein kinase [Gemmata massiliana]